MRSIALDVHRDFCEVAIKDESGLRLAGRIKTSLEELELFAQSLAPDDQVALEATGPAGAIARILEPHVGRVVIANTRKLRAIAESKVKTDKLDAKTLCELLAAGFLPAVWSPDEFTRALRRRLQRRSKLVRSRTRAKNECHAVLARNLKGRPPVTDVFGKRGREWLTALQLPADERETVECCLREVDFLDSEVGLIERELAREALSSPQIRRLMSVPATNRAPLLALVPANDRKLVEARLRLWDRLPPEAKRQLQTNEAAITYFAMRPEQKTNYLASISPEDKKKLLDGIAELNAMPPAQRQRLLDQFNMFFEFKPAQRLKILNTLSEPERQQIENTLRKFDGLSPSQRELCIQSFESRGKKSYAAHWTSQEKIPKSRSCGRR